jgi:outer membrane protein assembly factor BamB
MHPMRTFLFPALALLWPAAALAGDWPMWRYDAGRGAATPHALPEVLHLQWAQKLPAAQPAWPASQSKLQFDAAPEPVVMGQRIFVPSTVNDSVTAHDTRTGRILWEFTCDGPVRFAPLAREGRVYFVSDDGHLYCVDAEDGELLWKVNGGPARRFILGNERLVSSWPARGAPVLHQGKVYFAASIWPFMGIFVHAVDPVTGRIVWTNSGDGMNYTPQPHGGAIGFATIAPQGYLAAEGDHLIVPGGRSTPAVFDATSGKLKHFSFDKRFGGYGVWARGGAYFVDGQIYAAANGKSLGLGQPAIIDGTLAITTRGGTIQVNELGGVEEKTTIDRRGKQTTTQRLLAKPRYRFQVPAGHKVFIKAGPRIYTAAKEEIAAFEVGEPIESRLAREPAWSAALNGEVFTMLAADERLFAVTTDGRLLCYGGEHAREVREGTYPPEPPLVDERASAKAARLLQLATVKANQGGCLVALSIGDGHLIEELAKQSQHPLIVIDEDADAVEKFRARLQGLGLYGRRVAAHVGDPRTFEFPPYLASLVLAEDLVAPEWLQDERFLRQVFRILRPYGGAACLELSLQQRDQFAKLVQNAKLQQARVRREGEFTLLVREGALPGSDDWTHQYGDASQSGISGEQAVKAPLGLLWFGGPSHDAVLPRHGHGPSPQVAGGRLLIEGPDLLRATDVYTGRLLWEKNLKGLGRYYDTTRHFAGAGEIGGNYVSLADRVYAVYGREILEIDTADGETLNRFTLPAEPGDDPPYFGYLGVWEDMLVATADPLDVPPSVLSALASAIKSQTPAKREAIAAPAPKAPEPPKDLPLSDLDPPEGSRAKTALASAERRPLEAKPPAPQPSPAERAQAEPPASPVDSLEDLETRFAAVSRRLVAFDRHSGRLLWSREARFSFRHNNIALAAGKVFCIDSLTDERKRALARRGIKLDGQGTLYALDIRTGHVVWSTTDNVFGTFLNYSEEHDVLLQAGSRYRDRARDEIGSGMAAYRGSDGKLLWKNNLSHGGPCLLWRDLVITNGSGGFALKLKTGEPTGWRYLRAYGCNTAIGCQTMLTFRSGAAGFYDLVHDSGTGNIGGFRSSCTNNLIPANGVLNAPDYTRTCTCAYQNQTSLALVHMPDAELWTFGGQFREGRVGVNFGAPGDRRDQSGTLWVEYPTVGGPSDNLAIQVEPQDAEVFRFHSSLVQGEVNWVAASGLIGVRRIVLIVDSPRQHEIKLHFLEPDQQRRAGERVFNVAIAGRTLLSDLDILKSAGGPRRGVVRTFFATPHEGKIILEFTSNTPAPAVISGVELLSR